MKLIDADVADKWMRQNNAFIDADILKAIPTIDAVPVVRCRECKRWDADPDSYGKDDGPKGKCLKTFEETYPDDFCSYGQRKIETVLPKSDTKDEILEADHDKHPSNPV